MKSGNIAILVCCLVLVLGAFWSDLGAQNLGAQNLGAQDRVTAETQKRPSWEYARLVIEEDTVAWQAGETNVIPEVLTLEILYRRLGGRLQPNFTNLINHIGKDGWELIVAQDATWTFKRERQ